MKYRGDMSQGGIPHSGVEGKVVTSTPGSVYEMRTEGSVQQEKGGRIVE